MLVTGDSRMVLDLRSGRREFQPRTVARIEAFVDAYRSHGEAVAILAARLHSACREHGCQVSMGAIVAALGGMRRPGVVSVAVTPRALTWLGLPEAVLLDVMAGAAADGLGQLRSGALVLPVITMVPAT